VAFCQRWLNATDRKSIVFTDESTVSQNMNRGGLWRRKGQFLAIGTYERGQHPISVMVWGAIGPGFRSPLLRCPPHVIA
jgi:hypothetical protein